MKMLGLSVYNLEDEQRIHLVPYQWYAWQMLPGYGHLDNAGYFSPIWISAVKPQKSGKSILKLHFHNARYASGVQGFEMILRVLCRREQNLVAHLTDYEPPHQRDAVISRITPHWFAQHCRDLWDSHPPERMQNSLARSEFHYYLNELFFRDLRPESSHQAQ